MSFVKDLLEEWRSGRRSSGSPGSPGNHRSHGSPDSRTGPGQTARETPGARRNHRRRRAFRNEAAGDEAARNEAGRKSVSRSEAQSDQTQANETGSGGMLASRTKPDDSHQDRARQQSVSPDSITANSITAASVTAAGTDARNETGDPDGADSTRKKNTLKQTSSQKSTQQRSPDMMETDSRDGTGRGPADDRLMYRQQSPGIAPGRMRASDRNGTRTYGSSSGRRASGRSSGTRFGRSTRASQGTFGRDWDPDSRITQPWSAPIVVVSRVAPGLCYAGRMVGWDFHVVFRPLAEAAGAAGTQLYRNLRARLIPGWQIWKENFPDGTGTGRTSLDCLTFAGARAFLERLRDCPPDREHRQLLSRLCAAFAGCMPEGDLYPVPLGYPWNIHSLQAPPIPLRAFLADRVLVPVLLRDGEVWLALGLLCYWYRLDTYSLWDFERTPEARRLGLRNWRVACVAGRAQTYVPWAAAPDCLMALAAYWRGLEYPCWQRLVCLATMLATSQQAERLAQPCPGWPGSRSGLVREERSASETGQDAVQSGADRSDWI